MKKVLTLVVLCTITCMTTFAKNGDTTTRKVVVNKVSFTVVTNGFEQWGCFGQLPDGIAESLYDEAGNCILILEKKYPDNCSGCSAINAVIEGLSINDDLLTVNTTVGSFKFLRAKFDDEETESWYRVHGPVPSQKNSHFTIFEN